MHHSSEYYTLVTALRQPTSAHLYATLFYVPFACIVSPSAIVVHNHLNLIYQFWIHAAVVPKLGPLEWILNTPSHHRVHHGVNRYCIDKNYGSSSAAQHSFCFHVQFTL